MYISEDFPKDEGRCTYNACEQVLGKWCCLLFTIRRICKPLPNTWQCQLKPSTCHLPLQGLSPWPLQSLISNTPWKESKEEIRKEALYVLGKTSRTCLQVVRYFLRQRRFYEPNFLHLLISWKALKSLTVTSAPRGEPQTSAKMCAWLHAPSSLKWWMVLPPAPFWQLLGTI